MFTFAGFRPESSELLCSLGLSILFSWWEKRCVILAKNIAYKYFIERKYAFVYRQHLIWGLEADMEISSSSWSGKKQVCTSSEESNLRRLFPPKTAMYNREETWAISRELQRRTKNPKLVCTLKSEHRGPRSHLFAYIILLSLFPLVDHFDMISS